MPELPKLVEELFSVETTDPRNVALWLYYRGGRGFRELWPEFPEPRPFRILGERVEYDLQRLWLEETAAVREQRQADWSRLQADQRRGAPTGTFDPLLPFGQFRRWPPLALSEHALAVLLPLAERLERLIGTEHALTLPEGTPLARRLECMLVHLAQTELRAIWRRVETRDWPSGNQEELFFALSEDLGTLYNRAHVAWQVSKAPLPGGEGFALAPLPLVDPGLPLCYWRMAAVYEHTYRQTTRPGPVCRYCGTPLAGARRADAQHCGQPDCRRRWERDRKWYQRNSEEADGIYKQRTGKDKIDAHPADIRQVVEQDAALDVPPARRGRPFPNGTPGDR